jgi:hypothetical protein
VLVFASAVSTQKTPFEIAKVPDRASVIWRGHWLWQKGKLRAVAAHGLDQL